MIFGCVVGGVISAVCVGEVLNPLAERFHLASEVHERSQHQLHIVSQLIVDCSAGYHSFALLLSTFAIVLPTPER